MLGEIALAADAVHDLQVVVLLGDVGDEGEEVDGLPVVAERVHAPQRERGVADPAEAVVVVALAADRLGQRRAGRGADRAGGGVGQALERQRAALQVAAPRVVGEAPAGQPVLPVVRGPHLPPVRVLVGQRRVLASPRQRDEAGVALLEQRADPGPAALEAQAHVGGEQQLVVPALGASPDPGDRPCRCTPSAASPAVVGHRLALDDRLHLALDAADGAQQDVLGLVVGGRALLRAGQGLLVPPRADEQHVAHDDPAGVGAPAGLQHHRARAGSGGRPGR